MILFWEAASREQIQMFSRDAGWVLTLGNMFLMIVEELHTKGPPHPGVEPTVLTSVLPDSEKDQ